MHTCHVFEMKKKISIGRGFGGRLGPQQVSGAVPQWGTRRRSPRKLLSFQHILLENGGKILPILQCNLDKKSWRNQGSNILLNQQTNQVKGNNL
jgi:hypothetical protein